FTVWQLAGDLLPDATPDQILATAFHRNTMTNDEGGTDNEEFRVAAVKDRVDTTVQVWMGLTMGCAKCHSHKYDPISNEDYYRFYAYFNQTEDADRPDDAPRVPTPTSEQQQQQETLTQQLRNAREQLNQTTPELTAAQQAWEESLAQTSVWTVAKPVQVASEQGSTLTIQPDHSVLASGEMPAQDLYTIDVQVAPKDPVTALRLEILTDDKLPRKGPGRNPTDPNFVLSELTVEQLQVADDTTSPVALQSARADFSQQGWDVAKAIDGDTTTGWAISPKQGEPHVAVFELSTPITVAESSRLRFRFSQQYPANSLLIGRLRICVATGKPEQLTAVLQSPDEIAAIPQSERTKQQQQTLDQEFRRTSPLTAELFAEVTRLETELNALKATIPDTPIMRDLPAQRARETRVHVRGNFLEPGDVVAASLPEALAADAVPPTLSGNRLDVPNWLMHPANPLTARVAVNRVWAQLFGRGIVETEEDFGMQGSLPSHPKLLDWLATEFQGTHHWSHKQLCRTIVLSSAYRQSSLATSESLAADPDNRLWGRASRIRLSAEATRDQALAVSGLLSDRIGGPSVMPPQPDGIWRTTYSSLRWETPQNDDRYRRGIYTFIRRTSPYPSMLTFDGGSREVCQIRRIRTNTPLQALVTLNDPVFVEAAGALAYQCLTQVAASPQAEQRDKQLLHFLFQSVLVRHPDEIELQRLQNLLISAKGDFAADPDAASQLLAAANRKVTSDDACSPQDLAAVTLVASVVLNLDETLTRP
ncbi:MAG: DUF1553 domain-containing protein, partial [Planctomycetaceae bacterium]|nr:DUF1553 domain-containing protein [Planctomycetaceae bacterium]